MSAPDPECPLSELPASQCACRNHRGGVVIEPERVEVVGHTWSAMFGGRCGSGCERGIRAGDEIGRTEGGLYTHVECP